MMEKESIWQQTTEFPVRPVLQNDIRTEIAIVGGGMAGILTAHLLEQSGHSCVVLEADRIGNGQTGHTTAKVTSQHHMIYQKLMKCAGREKAEQYARINQEAIRRYEILIEKYQIDCEWTECPSCLYIKQAETEKEKMQSKALTRALRDEYHIVKELGLPAEWKKETELPFPVEGALYFSDQARFHPLKFLRAIAEEIQVYEKTRVLRADSHVLLTDHGRVEAEKIVFACHYPFVIRPGYYFLRMHQERSHVVALEHAGNIGGMYLGIDAEGLSFRPAGDLLLLGGKGYRTGENPCGGQYASLMHRAEQYWPDAKKKASWSAQDCMTLDGIPYIGKFGRGTEDWFVATGFGKWGMTSSMAAAMILTDQICGRENTCAEVFSPQRLHVMTSVKPFLQEGVYAAVNLVKERIPVSGETLAKIKPGKSGIIEYDGEKKGVYRTEEWHVIIVSLKCPHMGCQLAWNEEDKSWDCPCHGSRFDYQGRLLNEPAQTEIACCTSACRQEE